MLSAKLRLYSAGGLSVGDVVSTPSGREAYVSGFCGGRVSLRYAGDGGEVELFAHCLTLVRRVSPPAKLPKGFFAGDRMMRS